MTNNPKVLEASVTINIDLDDIWQLLLNKQTLETITSLTVRTDISSRAEKGNGVLTIGRGIFFINYAPYDIVLNGTQAKIRIQLMKLGEGSCIMLACLLSDNSILELSDERLEEFLKNLKQLAEATQTKRPAVVAESQNISESSHHEVPQKETVEATPLIFRDMTIDPPTDKKPKRVRREKRSKPVTEYAEEQRFPDYFGRRVLIIVLLLFMLSSLTLATFKRYLTIYDDSQYFELSATVNLKNAKEISFGDKKNNISYLFSSNGIPLDDNRVVYRASLKEGESKPTELIMVEYSSSSRVKAVSYLNLYNVSNYYNLQSFDADLTPDMTIDEATREVGIPFSLYKRYFDSNNCYIEEIHFGYLDPTANFNDAWRGEYQVIFNRTKETVAIKNWGSYDGSDPTMRGSIEGTPFANQYDNYTDFLNDRYQFSRSQLLLNRYSLGDTKFFFDGEPQHYSNNFGYQFYSIDSPEMIEDTDIPLYRISIGYDNKGGFQMASFSNMRLYNRGGTLKDSNYRLITRGMTYKEVRSLMNLVPTSIYIDSDYYSVCYGRFLDTEVTDEQFEVIIRFGLEDNLAHRVLINAAVSEVTDTVKTN